MKHGTDIPTDTMGQMDTQLGPLAGLSVGRIFAERYEIIELLGRGGMGAVYLARDREVGEEVALKVLETGADDDASAVERFRREVRLARRVTHPNAARTYDLGMCDGVRYLSMEYVSGRNLQEILRGTQFQSKQIVSIARQLCAGLGAAHEAGVVHRDLKPENILIESGSGRVVITDFGIARALDNESESMRTNGAIGTPAYMSPEQLECGLVDQRTDVYALGLILYQLCTGVHPFLKASAVLTAMARLTETPPAPASLCDVDAELSALIMQALSRDPEQRPSSMHDIAERLRDTESERFVPEDFVATPFVCLPADGKRIAIVPFRYRGPKEDEYLAEVLTEELVDIFSKTEGLRVVGPTHQQTVGGDSLVTSMGVLEHGKGLQVEAIVVGTIQKAGSQLRVAARLLECPSGRQIWSEKFNGDLETVFDLQDRIAKRVAEALRVELVHSTYLQEAQPEAVEAYLRARHLILAGNYSEFVQSVALLERCLALEPNFKPALAALAQARTTLWFVGLGDDPCRSAQSAVDDALRLAPELAESHLAAGVFATNSGDYVKAARSLARALEIAPTYGEAHDYLGRLQLEAGRADEGIERLHLALALNPGRPMSLQSIGREHALRGDWDAFDGVISSHRRLMPGGSVAFAFLEFRVALWRGELDKIRQASASAHIDPRPQYQYLKLFVSGLSEEVPPEEYVRGTLDFARGASKRMASVALQVTCEVLCFRESTDLALDILQRCAEGALVDLSWLDRCPCLDCIRRDPKFASARALVVARAEAIWAL